MSADRSLQLSHFKLEKAELKGFSRFLLAGIAFLVGGGLFFHIMPGFNAPPSLPYSLCLSYSKGFIALILLGSTIPTFSLQTSSSAFKTSFGLALAGAIFLTALLVLLRFDAWHPRFSLSFFPWAILTLFFTIVPEEALLRGFLQKELTCWLGKDIRFQASAVVISALVYPLFHLSWAGDISLLIPALAAGFTYALVYQATKAVETSILCHFLVQGTHFLFFDSPAAFNNLPCLGLGLQLGI